MSKSGRTLLSGDDFRKIFSSINFDIVECPYDDFNESIESKKRVRKAYDRTINLMDNFFEKSETQIKVILNFKINFKFFLKYFLNRVRY